MIKVYKFLHHLTEDHFQTKTKYLQPERFPQIRMSKSQNKNVWFR